MLDKTKLKREVTRSLERFFFAGGRVSYSDFTDPWARDLLSGVLRTFGRIDSFFEKHSTHDLRPTMRAVLAVSAYQIKFQDSVRSKTVVDEGILDARMLMGEGGAKLFSALIRKWDKHHSEWWSSPWPEDETKAARWGSVSPFYFRECVRSRGRKWTEEFLEQSFERPEIWCADSKGETFKYEGGALAADLEANRWLVQDLSNQVLVDRVNRELEPGQKVLDWCAAPGGKAIALAWKGFDVLATDASAKRMLRLQDNVKRLCTHEAIAVKSAKEVVGAFDAVWLDLPCSSSGLIRRHPDVRWTLDEAELSRRADLQTQIINEVLERFGKDASTFVVSTCSIFRSETERLLDLFPNFETQWSQVFLESDAIFGAVLRRKI